MNDPTTSKPRRRDVLLLALGSASVAAATASCTPEAANTEAAISAGWRGDKGTARYQATSPEVQTFYRVNRYPVDRRSSQC